MNKLDFDYLNILEDILNNGVIKTDRTGTGTISVFGRQIRHRMSDGFPLLTTKKMAWKNVITELIWFLRGDTNLRYLVNNKCHIWDGDAYKKYTKITSSNDSKWDRWMRDNGDGTVSMFTKEEFIEKIKTDAEFSEKWGDLGKIYGYQWRKWMENSEKEGLDQINEVINDLKNNPDSRRIMVTAWNPMDLPNQVLPPCHYGFQLWTRELSFAERVSLINPIPNLLNHKDCDAINLPKRAVSLMWNQRSCDFPLGVPFNITSYSLLLIIISKLVNMVPEELIGNFGDSHIYLDQQNGVREQLLRKNKSFPLPKLVLSNNFYNLIKMYEIDKNLNNFFESIDTSDFELQNYKSHEKIYFPLSN